MARQWSYADLAPDQLALVTEVEQALDDDVVMVYSPSTWGTVDPDILTAGGLRPDLLASSQLERLRRLEEQVGGVAVAYRRAPH